MPLRGRDTESPPNRGGLFELESLGREQTIRFRDESSGLINTLPREPDKLAYFESVLSSPDHTLSRKIRVTDVGKDVKGRVIGRSFLLQAGARLVSQPPTPGQSRCR
jgi:hypothetical protein